MTAAMAELPSGAVPAQTHIQSIDERIDRGRALRALHPRSEQSIFTPSPNRRDPVEILIEQGESRLPNLLPLRYARMKVSPFAFFRGGAAVMTEDLAGTPATGLQVQACGDCHLLNFGGFATPERNILFDINDFDETLPAPWEWDVKRLAASMEVAARDNEFTAKETREIVKATVASYRNAMRAFAAMSNLEVWYARGDMDQLRSQYQSRLKTRQRKTVNKGLAKARTRDSLQEVTKLTQMVNGRLVWAWFGPWLWIYLGITALVYGWYCRPYVRRLIQRQRGGARARAS